MASAVSSTSVLLPLRQRHIVTKLRAYRYTQQNSRRPKKSESTPVPTKNKTTPTLSPSYWRAEEYSASVPLKYSRNCATSSPNKRDKAHQTSPISGKPNCSYFSPKSPTTMQSNGRWHTTVHMTPTAQPLISQTSMTIRWKRSDECTTPERTKEIARRRKLCWR